MDRKWESRPCKSSKQHVPVPRVRSNFHITAFWNIFFVLSKNVNLINKIKRFLVDSGLVWELFFLVLISFQMECCKQLLNGMNETFLPLCSLL